MFVESIVVEGAWWHRIQWWDREGLGSLSEAGGTVVAASEGASRSGTQLKRRNSEAALLL